jgi:hypothetical protein
VTVKVVGGLWWRVAKRAESLGGGGVTWIVSVILAAMDTFTSDLSIDTTNKVIGRLWTCRVSKAKTLNGAWRRDCIV